MLAVNGSGAADARLSDALPFDKLDEVPEAIMDRILWASVHGPDAAPPPPGPNASPQEHARALGALRVLRRGGDVRAYLARTASDDGDG